MYVLLSLYDEGETAYALAYDSLDELNAYFLDAYFPCETVSIKRLLFFYPKIEKRREKIWQRLAHWILQRELE